ncbi:MAG: 16S rRNA (adenine(1518)-N(6)/adenine(1519)-N(6))-dimethyltransferase RsmA [Candidatus Odinarchaeota archaeon]
MNSREVQLILKTLNVKPNKNLGQNFLTDKNILKKIISISELSTNDVILEIGPGLGSITEELVKSVKKIYAIEIDYRLYLYLNEKFSIYDNVEVIHGDILKIEIPNHNKVISNIPYKITGPILEKVFFRKESPIGILSVQKSIADRIFFSSSYKNFSRISVNVNTFMEPVSRLHISQQSFYPKPKIPLSLIKFIPRDPIDPFFFKEEHIKFFLKLISGIMPYKNRNIVTAIYLFYKTQEDRMYTKEDILMVLRKNDFKNEKVFKFKIDEFTEISKLFYS